MSQPEMPESDLLRSVVLARAAQDSHSRNSVMWDLTDSAAFLQERILRLLVDETAPIGDDVRLTFLNIFYQEMNRQFETLFSEELTNLRRYLQYLRVLGGDISELNTTLVDLEQRYNALVDKAKRTQALETGTVKDALRALHPLVKEENVAKDDLKALRKTVDKKTFELLRIYCRKIDEEAADSLFRVLTQDL
jgi:hypothetical protein